VTGHVFLAGGGDSSDSRPLDQAFARVVGAGPLSYWPVAFDPQLHSYDECLRWLRDVYEPLGVGDITMWTGDRAVFPGDYRAVYIGGGNTYRLLALVRRWGLLDQLRDFVAGGGAVFGGSAGAAVLGADITTIAHLDRNEVGLDDTRGADLAAGHGVFVHHEETDIARETVWSAMLGRPALALSERANAIVTGNLVTAVGADPVVVVGTEGHHMISPGATSHDGLSVQ
jgi:dipeptidase E